MAKLSLVQVKKKCANNQLLMMLLVFMRMGKKHNVVLENVSKVIYINIFKYNDQNVCFFPNLWRKIPCMVPLIHFSRCIYDLTRIIFWEYPMENAWVCQNDVNTRVFLFMFFAEWHQCQIQASRKNIIDWDTFPSPEKVLSTVVIHSKVDAADQIPVLLARILGNYFRGWIVFETIQIKFACKIL